MKRLNILFIVLDTVRADRLSCYGYGRRTSPCLDQIAEESAVFTNAIAPAIWTVPSHVSMFTGLWLSEHRQNSAGEYRLDPRIALLAEVLRDAGYQTAAFSNNPFIGPSTGLERGFDTFIGDQALAPTYDRTLFNRGFNFLRRKTPLRDHMESRGRTRRAGRTVDAMLQWLGTWEPGGGPFFIFANFMEAHPPYNPPVRLLRRYGNAVPQRTIRAYGSPHAAKFDAGCLEITSEHRAAWRDLYDAEIAYLDSQIGTLCDELRARGLLDQTLLVLTSDHGDNLGDHGLVGHMICVYDTLLRVPLIVRHPGLGGGRRIETCVQLNDLFPTLLEVAQVPLSDYPKQTRRPGLLAHPGTDERSEPSPYVFSESYDDGPTWERFRKLNPNFNNRAPFVGLTSVRTARYKYIHVREGRDEFYDLVSDPQESQNLIEQTPPVLAEFQSALAEWRSSLNVFEKSYPASGAHEAQQPVAATSGMPESGPTAEVYTHAEAAQIEERLRELGYLD